MEFIVIIVSLLTVVLVGFFATRRSIIEFVSVLSLVIVFIASVMIAFRVAATGEYHLSAYVLIDALGALLLLIISCIGLTTILYSVQYLRKETANHIIGFTRVKQYFMLVNIFLLAMFMAVATTSPIITWISIEATTLSTALLISFYNKPSAIEGAWKYLIVNSVGLLLGFFGTLLYFTSFSTNDGLNFSTWHDLLISSTQVDPIIIQMAFIFILIGYGTKVGFAPMHTWKPDAYSKAPTPLGALFSSALLPVAFFVILKFKSITDSVVGPTFSQHLLLVFGILSIAIPALMMLVLKNYKRLLAYSSIENAGIMALGFGFGGLGISAAILHAMYHSMIKSALFFLSGNFLLKYHSAKIANVKGAMQTLPITSILFLIGTFAVTGAPPFGIFLTKMHIFSAGITLYPVITILAVIFTAFIFIGFLRHTVDMIFGKKPADLTQERESIWLILPPLALLLLVFYLSFSQPLFLQTLIHQAAELYN